MSILSANNTPGRVTHHCSQGPIAGKVARVVTLDVAADALLGLLKLQTVIPSIANKTTKAQLFDNPGCVIHLRNNYETFDFYPINIVIKFSLPTMVAAIVITHDINQE